MKIEARIVSWAVRGCPMPIFNQRGCLLLSDMLAQGDTSLSLYARGGREKNFSSLAFFFPLAKAVGEARGEAVHPRPSVLFLATAGEWEVYLSTLPFSLPRQAVYYCPRRRRELQRRDSPSRRWRFPHEYSLRVSESKHPFLGSFSRASALSWCDRVL